MLRPLKILPPPHLRGEQGRASLMSVLSWRWNWSLTYSKHPTNFVASILPEHPIQWAARVLIIYVAVGVGGTAAAYVALSLHPEFLPLPHVQPAVISPKAIIDEPSSQDISKAWDAVRASNDVVELTNFAIKYPNTADADTAWKRIRELVNAGGLKIASLSSNIDFLATILSHQDEALPALTPIVNDVINNHSLESKYPFGFAIFYADGHRVVPYGTQKQTGNITFDPSSIAVKFDAKSVCLSQLPIRINHQLMSNFTNICFGGNGGSIMHAVKFGDLAVLDIEPLGDTQQGLAWVIGMRPPEQPVPLH
jgi:hypothetical protein